MWGSIGFGIFGISTGYLVDVLSEGQSKKDYTCIFYIMLAAMILDIVVSATLKKVRNIPSTLYVITFMLNLREIRIIYGSLPYFLFIKRIQNWQVMGESSIVTEKCRTLRGWTIVIVGAVERCQRRKGIGVCLVVHRCRNVHRCHMELSVLVHRRPGYQLARQVAQNFTRSHDWCSMFLRGVTVQLCIGHRIKKARSYQCHEPRVAYLCN